MYSSVYSIASAETVVELCGFNAITLWFSFLQLMCIAKFPSAAVDPLYSIVILSILLLIYIFFLLIDKINDQKGV